MDHIFFTGYGGLLALSAFLFGVAHSIVVSTPPHPDYQFLRMIIRGRELVLVPLTILILSLPELLGGFQLGALSMITSVSLMLTVFLLAIAPQLRRVMADRVKEANSRSRLQEPTMQPPETCPPSESISSEFHLNQLDISPAITELKDQRRVNQVIWDLPVGIVLVDDDFRVQSKVGGLVRSRYFPAELSEIGASLPNSSTLRAAAAKVYRSHERMSLELLSGSKSYQVCVSPWVSMSGRIRGVSFMLTAFNDRSMTDESEVRYHA